MPNHLADETSPYLRQHQDNPVEWYPWGQKALSRAKQENKPIFLSIGYAACHWCHVMAHESFENVKTAQILNENFINIKVDREERPDIDDIYMQSVVMLTGQGGWPLSVFLTPELKPFYGGTYFPPTPRHQLPSFDHVLLSIIETWNNNYDAIINNADILTKEIQKSQTQQNQPKQGPNLDAIIDRLHSTYDWQSGGWGNAPKFPQPMLIEFLIQRALSGNQRAKEMVSHLLTSMAQGGMYDLVGGGFHRYSTDRIWLIPHFEKMLYDNAQLALVYLHGFALTGKTAFLKVVEQTLMFILDEMTDQNGAFISSTDADTSEGEGRYYGWNLEELHDALSEKDFLELESALDITPQGNFEDSLNILRIKANHVDRKDNTKIMNINHLDESLKILKKIRGQRIAPGKDKKIITEWNAMAICAFAEAGVLLNRKDYVAAAKKGAKFILDQLITSDGTLYRAYCEGVSNHPGTLADYAGLIVALNALYKIDFDPKYFEKMRSLFKTMQNKFASENSLYFDAADDVPNLLVRPRNIQDNATPSGNAMAAYAHWLLANYQHDPPLLEQAQKMVLETGENFESYPTSFGLWLQVVGLVREGTQQIGLVSHDGFKSLAPFLKVYRSKYRPFSIIAAKHADIDANWDLPVVLQDRPAINNLPTAYVCQDYICRSPTNDPDAFQDLLE